MRRAVRIRAVLENPQYPADAQSAGINGVVGVEVVIDRAGNVTEAKVVPTTAPLIQ